jgi:hypothetical protein
MKTTGGAEHPQTKQFRTYFKKIVEALGNSA